MDINIRMTGFVFGNKFVLHKMWRLWLGAWHKEYKNSKVRCSNFMRLFHDLRCRNSIFSKILPVYINV